MYSSFPDLNWARLRAYSSGVFEVFDCDGKTYQFKTRDEAINWLLEDEFIAFEKLDTEDEVDYGISISEISPPHGRFDKELISKMYVKAKKA